MCGLAGVLRLSDDAPRLQAGTALGMAHTIRHRGPDARTEWVSPTGRCALGHVRLAVIDPETGHQPMANETGSVQVVFNGAIYNFQELRAELEREGHAFTTRCDTEVLAHGWEAWGEGLTERIDGMFAFALWDEEQGVLFMARDRTGKKPLFWTVAGGRLVFASEMKALTSLPGVDPPLDPAALPLYLAYGYVPAPATMLQGVEKIPPAHSMLWRAGSGTRPAYRRYWRLDWSNRLRGIGAEEACSRVRDLMRDAVEKRLIADVPLGAFLSGGIDSTLVVGLMRELREGPLRTFSLGFADDPTYDETDFARLAAERFGTDHTEFIVEAEALERLDPLVQAYDEPFGDSSGIPTHIVSELTREHVTVALTGDGGDEMFAGYPRFLGAVIAERTPRWLAAVGNALGRRLPHHANFRHPTRRFSRFFAAAALPAEERTLRWIGYLAEDTEGFLRPECRGLVSREALLESFAAPLQRHRNASPLSRTLALNFETYLPEDLLVKADRCSMAHALELRSPFLDTAVMEFAAGLPDRMRVRGGTLKWLLRSAFADLLPPRIAGRGKMGFGIPLPTWLRTKWKGTFEERVLSRDARVREWLRPEPLTTLWREHQSGDVDHGHALWAVLTLESWLRLR